MTRLNRRAVLKSAVAGSAIGGIGASLGSAAVGAADANSEVRLAIIGLGGVDVPTSVGGRGRQLIKAIRSLPQARIVSLCDVDESVLAHGVELMKKANQDVSAHTDLRRVFDDDGVDAVVVATPNHWHALATVWACQAGKDVYVEKPFSHNIWEGRQMIAAARKHQRIVQVGTQSRSSTLLPGVFDSIRNGMIGPMRSVHAIVYRPRPGIGNVSSPTPVPSQLDYNLWCGPIQQAPVMRPELHYQWHWFWDTGNGEIGNTGPHTIDLARWALGHRRIPKSVMSIGGRYGKPDCAETANTQIAIMDFEDVPMICEVRNLGTTKDGSIGKYRGTSRGVIVECEGGHCFAEASSATVFDRQGKKIREFRSEQSGSEMLKDHLSNFLSAVQSRDLESLKAEAVEGHLSAICFHGANVSHRLGTLADPDKIRGTIEGNPLALDAYERFSAHLRQNGVDRQAAATRLGPALQLDGERQAFVGTFADEANSLSRRTYREPFVVPELV